MREIKFRAWDKKGKTMYVVALLDMLEKKASLVMNCDEDVTAIMQYTGLKDSYANDEYWGDIIEEDDGTRRIIEDGNSAVWFINTKEKFDVKYFWMLKVHKVIGNIYENPELLERAK